MKKKDEWALRKLCWLLLQSAQKWIRKARGNDGVWHCHHLPKKLVADRGELESHYADRLGVKMLNEHPYRGDLKGIVERQFGMVNEKSSVIHPARRYMDP